MNVVRLAALVRQLQGAVGGRKFRAGTASLSWSASTTAGVTVTHGLGETPTVVLLTVHGTPSALVTAHPHTIGATTFAIQGVHAGVVTETRTVSWLALA